MMLRLWLLLGLLSITSVASAQTPSPYPTATAPAPSAQPGYSQHTHYHFYSGMSPDNWLAPWTNIQAKPFVPTQAQPFPPSYVPGYYAAPPFPNQAPNAPASKGVIHVFLPAKDATVYLNGILLKKQDGKDRKITTPALPPNQDYQYILTAKFIKDNEFVTEYRKVIVGAGEYAVADFTRPAEPDPIKLKQGPLDPNQVDPAAQTGDDD